jgi:hypothetical protein
MNTAFKNIQNYIAKNFCCASDVKRTGSKDGCQLKKIIAEHEKQKKEIPLVKNEKQNINFCTTLLMLIIPDFSEIKLLRDKNQMKYPFLRDSSVFHPPKDGI